MIAHGSVLAVRGGFIEARLPGVAVGDGVRVECSHTSIRGIVTALRDGNATIAAYDGVDGAGRGDAVRIDPSALALPLGTMLLGRCCDARGAALDGGPPPRGRLGKLAVPAPHPSQRVPVAEPFWTGVRAIDALLTLGRGARAGIFGPPGAGKSTLLHALMRGSSADAVVVGLVGERGREAEEWMRLAPRHATIFCATSDRSAAERVCAARAAMAQADALRRRGLHVLAIVDSLARFAAALRELAAGTGEPVGRGGYPPSVFADLARYVEIAGPAGTGSITLAATVLSDGDERDPVSEAARSLMDGHLQLSAELAQSGRFPAIDLLASASRTMSAVAEAGHLDDARTLRGALAVLGRTADARALGIAPSEPAALRAMAAEARIEAFLRQGSEPVPPRDSLSALRALADTLR